MNHNAHTDHEAGANLCDLRDLCGSLCVNSTALWLKTDHIFRASRHDDPCVEAPLRVDENDRFRRRGIAEEHDEVRADLPSVCEPVSMYDRGVKVFINRRPNRVMADRVRAHD